MQGSSGTMLRLSAAPTIPNPPPALQIATPQSLNNANTGIPVSLWQPSSGAPLTGSANDKQWEHVQQVFSTIPAFQPPAIPHRNHRQ
ncbi:hypothetical protein C0991_011064 [Blastosporella zonata]|nr:hypothetical protein C0991_011064 [Blastosporella zonata]